MTPKMFSLSDFVFRKLLPYGIVLLFAAGCAATRPAATPPPEQPKRAAHPRPQQKPPLQKPVDAKAQKRYYDQGLQYYSAEDYSNAKEAFAEVVDLGPNTALGIKAQENLKKIEKILKTLDELESK
jgi:TolA-binding protein